MGFDLGFFALMGAQASTNPVQMANAALLALGLLLLRRTGRGVFLVFSINFIAILVILGVIFDLRVLSISWTEQYFLVLALWSYLILGLGFMFVAAGFFREWRSGLSGHSPSVLGEFISFPKLWVTIPPGLAVILAGMMAFLSNVWPPPLEVLMQGSLAASSGNFLYSLQGMFIYELAAKAGVLAVIALVALSRWEKTAFWFEGKKSIQAVMISAAYFAVGAALAHFFYMGMAHPWF